MTQRKWQLFSKSAKEWGEIKGEKFTGSVQKMRKKANSGKKIKDASRKENYILAILEFISLQFNYHSLISFKVFLIIWIENSITQFSEQLSKIYPKDYVN